LRIDLQYLLLGEVADEQVVSYRIEADAQQQRAAVIDLQRAQQAAVTVEHDDRADGGVAADVEVGDVQVAMRISSDAFRMRGAGRQRGELRGRAAIPCAGRRRERQQQRGAKGGGKAYETHDCSPCVDG